MEPALYRFGPYEVRVRTRELYKGGTRLKVRPQPFHVLRVLVEHAGDVVTREELRRLLWPAQTFVDFEHGLNTSVRELRRILCDSASQPRYIETLPKLGYRIVAPVEAEPAPPMPPAAEVVEPPVAAPAISAQRLAQPTLRLQWAWIGALTILFVVLAGWSISGRRLPPENSMPAPLTSFRGSEQAASWSPDGRQVAFIWNGEGQDKFDVYAMQAGSSQTLRLTSGAGDNFTPAWSPDSKWIAYVHSESRWGRSSLNLVSPLGGPIRTVLTNETAIGRISWMPDGHALVLEIIPAPKRPAELWVVWVDSGGHRRLTSPPPGIPGDADPAVSPDGRTVAFSRATFWRTAELYLLDLKPDLTPAAPPRRLTDIGSARGAAWTADGKRIVFDGYCAGAGLCEVDRGGGPPRPVFGVPPTASQPAVARHPGGAMSLSFTNFTSATTVWRYSTESGPGGLAIELVSSSHTQACPRYSPDGHRLAFASDRTGYLEIWASNEDGSQPVQLTDLHRLLTETPDWSPSGAQIAFVSQDRADRQIYVVGASGGLATAITNQQGIRSGDGWSHDGSEYYYTSARSGRPEVWKVPIAGGKPRQVTASGGMCGFESPSGVFYYWQGEIDSPGTLMQRTAEGDRPVPLKPQGITCRNSPSSTGFYFKAAGTGDIYRYDEASRLSARVLRRPDRPFVRFSVSPDGNWGALDFRGKETSDLMVMEHFR